MAIAATLSSFAFFSGNPIFAEVTSGLVGVQPNIRIRCLVSLSDGATYRTYATHESINASGKFLFNLGPQIDGIISDWFDKPEFGSNFTICARTPILAEISFTEIYDGEIGDSTTSVVWILQGGLEIEELDSTSDWWTAYTLLLDDLPDRTPFLTNKPRQCIWKPSQPEVLYYYNKIDNNITLTVNIECFDKYGNSLDVLTYDKTAVLIDKVLMINIGKLMYDRFSIAPDDGRYNVWITYSGDPVSEKRSYFVDTRKYSNVRFLSFLNKKGTFDIVPLTGRDIEGGTSDSELIGKEYVKGQKIDEGIKTVTRKQKERTVKKNTGPLNISEVTWLRELVDSKIVFEIIKYNPAVPGQGRLLPIIISNKDLPASDTNLFVSGYTVEYNY